MNSFFFAVLVVFGRPGVAFARVAEFADHAAQSLVGAKLDDAAQVHADFGAVVAAQHRAVVDQSDAAPQPGRRGRGAHACDAAAHDDEIERFGGLRRCGDAEHPFAECSEFRASGRRDVALFGGEIDGVAAAVESGKVGQRNADRTFRTETFPAHCHIHSLPCSRAPRTVSGCRPGGRRAQGPSPSYQGATQLNVRRRRGRFLIQGNSTVVTASATGLPMPCAMR